MGGGNNFFYYNHNHRRRPLGIWGDGGAHSDPIRTECNKLDLNVVLNQQLRPSMQ